MEKLIQVDIVIAGGGPAGLSAAAAAAAAGARVLVIERNPEIGSPTRTSGGSFLKDLLQLGIPAEYLHSIQRCRFVSRSRSAVFDYAEPLICVMDVRGVYQYLATEAIRAGSMIWPATTAVELRRNGIQVTGLSAESRTKGKLVIDASLVIDATGYKRQLLRSAGVHSESERFGVGAEYDLFAPNADETEAVLIVGNQVAPSGYAWAFPWGRNRIRIGVGVIHPDSRADPVEYLDKLVASSSTFGIDLNGAQPIEYHHGLIPSDLSQNFVGDGIIGVGDAAGHASTLVGEGIRWAIKAGRMAGTVAARAVREGDVSKGTLQCFETEWRRLYGRNLEIANRLNRKIAGWDDAKWDDRTQMLSLLTPEEFSTALEINFSLEWALGVAWAHPQLLRAGLHRLVKKLGVRVS